jgi:hypothetical protein
LKLIATQQHSREFELPLILSVGDTVQIDLTRGSHWLGEVFCTLPNGQKGWVSRLAFENLNGSNAIATQAFSSAELEIEMGDVLKGYANTYSATWCCNTRGESGWVSHDCYEIDQSEHRRRITKLIEDIEIAFANVEKGDGIGFREALQRDATFSNDEAAIKRILEAREQDVEHWFELSDEFVQSHGVQVYLWTDSKGFFFMLPALMRCVLREMLGLVSSYFADSLMDDLAHADANPSFLYQFDQNQLVCFACFCEMTLDYGIHPLGGSTNWQLGFTQRLLELIGRSLSLEWFKAPLQ